MDSISERIIEAIGHLLKMTEPKTVLMITENEAGEIIGTRIEDVYYAIFILRHAKQGREFEEKPSEFESLWWTPPG